MTGLKVLSVTSEIYPLIKTGGLADVAGALPEAVQAEGIDMRSLVPGYPVVLAALEQREEVHSFDDLFGGPAWLLAGKAGALELFVLHAPHLYGRAGNPYTKPDGTDWPDNAFRFAALAKCAAAMGEGLVPSFAPDVLHAHDWQAGLTPAYRRYSGKEGAGTVFTVHNLAFQGQFSADIFDMLGLPPEAFSFDGIEHYGTIGYMKAALQLSDRITTVSPSYAEEIQRPDTGMGLDGLLRARAGQLSGILNGIDTKVWNSATDPQIVANYHAHNVALRSKNKTALQEEFGLPPNPETLVAGVVSRLSWQKGLDLLLEALPVLLAHNVQLVLLGVGDPDLREKFLHAARAHPGEIAVRFDLNEKLAHRVQAGADVILIPSRYEPCGLTQLCAMHYGAVPVVARVGGLSDTIIDANEMALTSGVATGVQFAPVTTEELTSAIRRAVSLYADTVAWRTIQRNGMMTDVSWRRPARRYAALYRELAAARKTDGKAA